MKTVLFGATRGIGRAIARELAARGDALFLLGRDEAELGRSCADLRLRGAASADFEFSDLLEPRGFEPALARAEQSLCGLDCVIVTAALFATQAELEQDTQELERLLRADFVNTVVFCEASRRRLLARGGGTLCVLSSVAGDRARAL